MSNLYNLIFQPLKMYISHFLISNTPPICKFISDTLRAYSKMLCFPVSLASGLYVREFGDLGLTEVEHLK